MSRPSKLMLVSAAALAFFLSASAAAQRYVDPPGRVARIGDMRGDVAYSPAGDGEWYSAHRNRPLVRGDSLWSGPGARAELQAGSTWIRTDQETSLEFLELSDRLLQIEVAEGNINVRIRRMYAGQRVEVDTPNLAIVFNQPGNFRIDVDREGDTTTVEARQGGGIVYGVGGQFPLRTGDVVVFYGEDVRDYELYAFPGQDSFDRYARQRDQYIDRSPSLRFLGDDLVGFADLDQYGRWSRYPEYGAVWFPSNVYDGWAPYQDGQWIWQEPWGWTWVDDEPWGFASSHYGRWAWIDDRWGWVPGPRTSRSVYAPALVAFTEDVAGSIGWFPLGPDDIYYPSYSVSSSYFSQINSSNSGRTAPRLGNAYTRYGRASAVPLEQGMYRNRTVPTAVTVVPRDVFTNARPVREAAVRNGARAARIPGEMRRSLSVRPGAVSLRGAANAGRLRPPREVEDEQVFVRTAPPAQQVLPSAGPTPAPAVRERPRRVRMISEQSARADARASGPRPEAPAQAGAPSEALPALPPGQLRQLDREALPRERGNRRGQGRGPNREIQATPATPATPATAATPATPATPAVPPQDAERQAREERRAAQQQRQAEQQAVHDQQQAEREAQRQQREADRAQRHAEQQRAEEAARSAAQAPPPPAAPVPPPATPVAEPPPATAAEPPVATDQPPSERPRRECVPVERVEAMRERGVSEERIAKMTVCPAEPVPPPIQ